MVQMLTQQGFSPDRTKNAMCTLGTLLGTPALIYAIVQSANRVAAAQCKEITQIQVKVQITFTTNIRAGKL